MNLTSSQYQGYLYNPFDPQHSTLNPQPTTPRLTTPSTHNHSELPPRSKLKMGDLGLVYNRVRPIFGPFLFIS